MNNLTELEEQARLKAAADKVTELAIEANAEYGIPVDPDVAEFMGICDADSIEGHED